MKPNWFTLAAFGVLAAEFYSLAFIHRDKSVGRKMLSAFPISCLIFGVYLSQLIMPGIAKTEVSHYSGVVFLILTTILQAVFVCVRPLKLRTKASDGIYSAASVVTCLFVMMLNPFAIAEVGNLFSLGAVILAVVTTLLPTLHLHNIRKLPFIYTAMLLGGIILFPLRRLFPNCAKEVLMLIIAGFYGAICVLSGMLKRDKKIDFAIIVTSRIVIGVYTYAAVSTGGYAYPFLALLAVLTLFRGIKNQSVFNFVFGIIFSLLAILATSLEVFSVTRTNGLFFVCAAATMIYILSNFAPKHILTKTAKTTSKYALFIVNCVSILRLANFDEFQLLPLVITLFFTIAVAVLFYREKCSYPVAIPVSFYCLVIPTFVELCIEESQNLWQIYDASVMTLAIVAVMILLSLVPSYILHAKKLFDEKIAMLDPFILTRFVWIICYFMHVSDRIQGWFGILLLGVCFASLYRKEGHILFKKTTLTISSLLLAFAWACQPFITIPDILVHEFTIMPFLLFCFVLRFIWKKQLSVIKLVTFVVYSIAILILFSHAVAGEELLDSLILATISLAILLIGFVVKQKKWFILGVVALVADTLFMTRNFWLSLAWWVYLLVVGVLLVTIAASNEFKKQAVAKGEKPKVIKKWTRFMSEWKW